MNLNPKTLTPDTNTQKHKLCKSGNKKSNTSAIFISQKHISNLHSPTNSSHFSHQSHWTEPRTIRWFCEGFDINLLRQNRRSSKNQEMWKQRQKP